MGPQVITSSLILHLHQHQRTHKLTFAIAQSLYAKSHILKLSQTFQHSTTSTNGSNNIALTEVGKFETLRQDGKYELGQLFLHRVFGYRGIILYPWMAIINDNDIKRQMAASKIVINEKNISIDTVTERDSTSPRVSQLNPTRSDSTLETDSTDHHHHGLDSSNKSEKTKPTNLKSVQSKRLKTLNMNVNINESIQKSLSSDAAQKRKIITDVDNDAGDKVGMMENQQQQKPIIHPYYLVLIDSRDCSYVSRSLQTAAVTFLGQYQGNSRQVYSIKALDYVAHEDVLPYSSNDPRPIHHELFDKFFRTVSTSQNNTTTNKMGTRVPGNVPTTGTETKAQNTNELSDKSPINPYNNLITKTGGSNVEKQENVIKRKTSSSSATTTKTIFDRRTQQASKFVARDSLELWKQSNPWLELSHVYRETTENIRVTVIPFFLGSTDIHKTIFYWWRYCVRLENLGQYSVKLIERDWKIFSMSGTLETIKGRGVVGIEPILTPKQESAFQYSSHINLVAQSGHMWGTFKMLRPELNDSFDCKIPSFALKSDRSSPTTNSTPPTTNNSSIDF